MKNPNVLIAIGHGLYKPWLNILHDGQEKTWLLDAETPGVSIIHFHGSPVGTLGWKFDRIHEWIRWHNRWFSLFLRWMDRFRSIPFLLYIPKISKSKLLHARHPSLHIHFPDTYQNVRWKDLAVLNYFVKERTEDFIFFTTTSSYVVSKHLLKVIKEIKTDDFYGGVIPYSGATFAAGNNRILSRSVAVKVLENKILFDPGYIEDVAMGRALSKLKIELIALPSINLNTIEDVKSLNASDYDQNYHFRVKSGTFKKRGDVSIMNALHQRFVNEFKSYD